MAVHLSCSKRATMKPCRPLSLLPLPLALSFERNGASGRDKLANNNNKNSNLYQDMLRFVFSQRTMNAPAYSVPLNSQILACSLLFTLVHQLNEAAGKHFSRKGEVRCFLPRGRHEPYGSCLKFQQPDRPLRLRLRSELGARCLHDAPHGFGRF